MQIVVGEYVPIRYELSMTLSDPISARGRLANLLANECAIIFTVTANPRRSLAIMH